MRIILLLALVACLLCVGSYLLVREPPPKDVLLFGRGGDTLTLDPPLVADGESAVVGAEIFECLGRMSDDRSLVEPCLARSWEVSLDGMEWTFHLRDGVAFHDGSPVTADSVVFSLLRKLDPGHPYHRLEFTDVDRSLACVESVHALDRLTVRIKLKEPFAPFLTSLVNYADIVSPLAVRKWGDEFGRHPVGTGPFRFREWIPQDRIILERNEEYWGEKPGVRKLIFRTIPGNRERLLALKTGSIQVMDGINPEARGDIARRPDLRFEATAGMNIAYLAMNLDKAPFGDLRVRRAVNHAINKANLVALAYRGMATPAVNPIAPTMWGYHEGINGYAYDPAAARRLLAEAGLPTGFETSLWVMSIPRPYMPQPAKIAEAIKDNLEAVGIRAKIRTCDWDSYVVRTARGEHDMALLGYSADTPDPDDLLSTHFCSEYAAKPNAENIAFFKNAEVDELLRQARWESVPERRIDHYRRVLEMIHDLAPWVPLAHAQQAIAYRREVHGLFLADLIYFRRAWIEES